MPAVPNDPLTRLERLQINFIRRTFDPGTLERIVRWLQSNVGRRWIVLATRNLHRLHHIERVPQYSRDQSFILVANHRSFFDMYVVTANLLGRGLPQRFLFPVRSTFFYDSALGFFVNGVMSFFAMYPPLFREKKKAALNAAGLDEAIRLLRQGGHLVGFHPEGTRNKGDPYTLLPMRSGVGRLIHGARVPVVPVFTNGLRVDDLYLQVKSNFDGTGTKIHTVFGEPIDFGTLLEQPASQATFKQIANRVGVALAALAEEERQFRAEDTET